jgi:hypothetical protein
MPTLAGVGSEYDPDFAIRALSYAEGYAVFGDVAPTTEHLCDELKIGKPTCYRWANEHEEFGNILDQIKAQATPPLAEWAALRQLCSGNHKLMLSATQVMTHKSDKKNENWGELPVNIVRYGESTADPPSESLGL